MHMSVLTSNIHLGQATPPKTIPMLCSPHTQAKPCHTQLHSNNHQPAVMGGRTGKTATNSKKMRKRERDSKVDELLGVNVEA